MQNLATEKVAFSFASFVIKILKIPCPITFSSLSFETRELTFTVATILLTLFILTFLSSLMHFVFDLDELFKLKLTF